MAKRKARKKKHSTVDSDFDYEEKVKMDRPEKGATSDNEIILIDWQTQNDPTRETAGPTARFDGA